MKRLALALLLGSALGFVDTASASDGRLWTYQYLLATSVTERELAPITEHIVHEELLQVPELLDFAAEVLLARMGDSAFPMQNKLRLIRVVGADESGRYNGVLARVLESSKDSLVEKEVRSARVKEPVGAGYVPGTVDIRAIVAEMDAAALAAKPTTAQGAHLASFPGGSIADLFEWAGKPQQIISGQTRITDGILIHVKIQRLAFFYRGLGRVVYGYEPGKAAKPGKRTEGSKGRWQFQTVVADPLAFEQEFSYRDRAKELGLPDDATLEMTQLVSGYTASMKNVVERNYHRASRPLEFMDTAAETLATQFKNAQDPATVDMYAWICRLLTKHGGQRYAAILERVAAETPDDKLRRFARLPIETTTEIPAAPYVPGTISLAAQRAKYPSPYPESTFYSGHL